MITLLAHGSPDPRHARDVQALANRLTRSGAPALPAFLEHNAPTPAQLARDLAEREPTTVVPLLVTPAYHARVDVPAAVGAMRAAAPTLAVTPAAPIGLDPLLVAAAGELARGAGQRLDAGAGLVLVGTGTRTPGAVAPIEDLVARHGPPLATDLGIQAVRAAFLDGGPPIHEATDALRRTGCRQVLVVTLVIADGILRDRIVSRARALGLNTAPGTLSTTAALARLVRQRVSDAEVAPSA